MNALTQTRRTLEALLAWAHERPEAHEFRRGEGFGVQHDLREAETMGTARGRCRVTPADVFAGIDPAPDA